MKLCYKEPVRNEILNFGAGPNDRPTKLDLLSDNESEEMFV